VVDKYVGETEKNLERIFSEAGGVNAVLFFDEADAIAARRSTSTLQPMQRESNTIVNVLLRELESFNGVVIFATNLAANFDPAFERRIRTHVLFERPGVNEREQIWRVQIHPDKTPLAPDVNFPVLAEMFDASGGEIKNAVLKAAAMAAGEPATGLPRAIHQAHFEAAMREVLTAKSIMKQSLFAGEDVPEDNAERRVMAAFESAQARWAAAVKTTLIVAGAALLLAAVSLLVALVHR
jgi:SpoVK/Ycf46/Vps4 family AAA+-type ATPase